MLRRLYSTATHQGYQPLRQALGSKIPAKRELYQELKSRGATKLGDLTIGGTIGGMRGYESLVWESSKVDPDTGVTFHGLTIPQVLSQLPTAPQGGEVLPEAMFWFLITGEMPTKEQSEDFVRELNSKLELPKYLKTVLDSLPKTMHPMTQLSIAISSLNNDSVFASAYAKGLPKDQYWDLYLTDSLNLISKLPAIVGRIYSNVYHNGKPLGTLNPRKDWSYNMASVLGMTQDSMNVSNLTSDQSTDFVDLLRLYLALHADHEGGNVSAHTSHLVGSALSDTYLSLSAGIQGLAGPLHGLAAQEVVSFILGMREKVETNSPEAIEQYLWSLLNSKRVIPGYGHGVLRAPDPRFSALLKFTDTHESLSKDANVQLVKKLSQIAPEVLKKTGKVKNPFPNVDSISGVCFWHYGLRETLFMTVVFGASRSLGVTSQLVWDRILGMPIERPKSVTLAGLAHLK